MKLMPTIIITLYEHIIASSSLQSDDLQSRLKIILSLQQDSKIRYPKTHPKY